MTLHGRMLLPGLAASILLPSLARAGGDPIDDLAPGTWYEIPDTPMRAVCPENTPEYDYAFYCQNVTAAWGGAALDTTRGRLVVWGGGHADYRGNEVYVFDVHATQWERVWGPTADAQIPAGTHEQYDDGAPSSRHTYAGLTYVPAPHDALYSMGGSKWQSGGYAVSTWSFAFETLQWTRRIDGPASMGYGDPSVFDPITGHVFRRSNARVLEYDPAGDVYIERAQSDGGFWQDNVAAAIDPEARLVVIIGDGRLDTYDIATDTYTLGVEIDGPGVEELFGVRSPGCDFDTSQGEFVVWGGGLDLYTYDPAARTFSLHEGGGDDPGTVYGSGGAFGRFRYVPSRNVFVWAGDVDANVFVVRMTEGTGAPPRGGDDTGGSGSTGAATGETGESEGGREDTTGDAGPAGDDESGIQTTADAPAVTSGPAAGSTDDTTGGCGCRTDPSQAWLGIAWLWLLAMRRRTARSNAP